MKPLDVSHPSVTSARSLQEAREADQAYRAQWYREESRRHRSMQALHLLPMVVLMPVGLFLGLVGPPSLLFDSRFGLVLSLISAAALATAFSLGRRAAKNGLDATVACKQALIEEELASHRAATGEFVPSAERYSSEEIREQLKQLKRAPRWIGQDEPSPKDWAHFPKPAAEMVPVKEQPSVPRRDDRPEVALLTQGPE